MTAPGPSTANMEFQLRLIKAKDLAAKDITGKSDPFIKWTVDGKKKGKSKIVKQNLNPEWNETYFWDGCTERTVIKGEMWDHDLVGKDFMGCFQIDTADMMVAVMEPVEKWIPLQKRSSSDKVSGEVLINIQFRQKPSANFDINAARALTAEISNQQNATPDANPYAPAPGGAPPTLPQHNSALPPIPTSSHPPSFPPSTPGGASAIPPSPWDQPPEPPVAPVAPGPPPPPPPQPRLPQLHHPPTQFVSQHPPETAPRALPQIPAPTTKPPPSLPSVPSQSHQDPHNRPLPTFGGPPQLPPSNPPSLPHSNPPSLPPSNPPSLPPSNPPSLPPSNPPHPSSSHHVPIIAPPMSPPEDTPPIPRRQPPPALPPHHPAASSAPESSKPTLIATWDYQAANDTELSLSVGNRYTYDKEEDGWYQGTDVLTGKFGWFPGNYTKKEE